MNTPMKFHTQGSQGLPVLGADTLVVLDVVLFGKPRDGAEAQGGGVGG